MLQATRRSAPLDGLRGIASVAVIFYHSILFLNPRLVVEVLLPPVQSLPDRHDIPAKLLLSLVNGHMAVAIFFVLSGFVLSRSLDRMEGSPPTSVVLRFSVRRLFRLYPAILGCMLAFFAVSLLWHTLGLDPVPGLPDPDPLSAIQNALLTKIAWHGATWTIQGEVLAVPFILGFYFLRRWLGEIGLVFGLCYCLLSRENPGLLFSLPNITAVLTPMVIGMIAAAPGARAIGGSMPPWTLWAMPQRCSQAWCSSA